MTKRKKYFVHPGFVRSATDGEVHYVTCDKLINLYGVPPEECIKDMGPQSVARLEKEWLKSLIQLYPRGDGNYDNLPVRDSEGAG